MKTYCKKNLIEIKELIKKLNTKVYTQKLRSLSEASLGQHVRHILEFYICLLNGLTPKIIIYDNRARNLLLETDINYACDSIDRTCKQLENIPEDVPLTVKGNYSSKDDLSVIQSTSLLRELAFCLDHSTHHQALIKIGLRELNLFDLIRSDFGVSSATIRHKIKCAQ